MHLALHIRIHLEPTPFLCFYIGDHATKSVSNIKYIYTPLSASRLRAAARVPLIDSRADVISVHTRWPIRTSRPICANQDA